MFGAHTLRRKFVSFIAAVSLLLCLATAALWVRSHFVSEHVAHAVMSGPAWVARSSGGEVYIDHRSRWEYAGGWSWGRRQIPPSSGPLAAEYQQHNSGFRFLGFGIFGGTKFTWPAQHPGVAVPANRTDPRWWRDRYFVVSFPHWFAVLVFGILPVRWYRQLRREQLKANRGRCAVCGYDLRATPDRCPECGTIPATETPALQ